MNELFSRRYDVGPEMLLDFVQQALTGMPTVVSCRLADSGDRLEFTTSFTLTSWGENMVATVEASGPGGSVLRVSGEPRVGLMATPWGEEMHANTIETQLFAALDPSIQLTRTNPIVMLQADHRRVEALFARIQATDDGERAELVGQLLLALQVHMELEENHVYPLLQQEVDPDLAEEAEVEHHLARDGLAQLEELTPDEPGFDAALAMVMAGIEHHVAEEESEAFPRLASQLGPDRLAELAEQLMAARADLLEQAQHPQKPEAEQPGTGQEESETSQETRETSGEKPEGRQAKGAVSLRATQEAQRAREETTQVREEAPPSREEGKPATGEAKQTSDDAKRATGGAKRATGAAKQTSAAATKQTARPPRPKRDSDRTRTPRNRRARAKVNPDETTKADLVERARKAGVSGYSHMTKAELAKALTRAQ